MAALHNWTYTQTTRQPRLFVQELLARHEAQDKHQKKLDKAAAKQNALGGVPGELPEIGDS